MSKKQKAEYYVSCLSLLQYYQECHGLIYVVDSIDKQRIDVAANIFSTYLYFCVCRVTL